MAQLLHLVQPQTRSVDSNRVAKSLKGARVNRRRTDNNVAQPPAQVSGTTRPAERGQPHDELGTEDLVTPIRRLSGAGIGLIMGPLCLSVLLSALDITILTPAIPSIVSAFDSATGYVWVGGAFILANTAGTPIWASLADIWGRKPIVLTALTIFLGGSLLCALAPQMDALIAGRAVQGLGASGMSTMVNVIICDTFSLRDRGLYLAITSVVWAIGSGVGPVIGGIFATRLE
jgi:hypothetical protein